MNDDNEDEVSKNITLAIGIVIFIIFIGVGMIPILEAITLTVWLEASGTAKILVALLPAFFVLGLLLYYIKKNKIDELGGKFD